MAKSETIEAEYLGDMYAKHGGELGWAAFGSGGQPDELTQMLEEGEQMIDDDRAEILNTIFELALSDFQKMPLVQRVGFRMISIASACGHPQCFALPLPGASNRLGITENDERRGALIRGILAFLLHGANTLNPESVGKQVLSVAIFLNREELTGWSMSAIGRGCAETPAGTMERIRRMCSKPIERMGGKGKATWQQAESQRSKSSLAQTKSHASRKKSKSTPSLKPS